VFVGVEFVELGGHLELEEVDAPPEDAADAAEAAAELGALLTSVGDEFEGGAEVLVVVGEPFDEGDGVDDFEVAAVLEVVFVLLLVLVEVEDLVGAGGLVAEGEAVDVEVFPDDEGFDGAEVEGLEGVADHEAVLAGVLGDFRQSRSGGVFFPGRA